VPQYYVENSHPAIITPEVFDLVQHEIRKRKNAKGYKTGGGCFPGKIICGNCGSFFGSKVWHSTSKYRRVIWQCNHKFKNEEKCTTPHLYEDDLKDAFVKAFNSLLENREEILEGYEAIIETLTDTSRLDKESARLQSECEVVAELVRKCVEENASTVMNQKDYQERYTELVERYEEIKRAISENCNKRQEGNARKESIKDFIRMLEKSEALLAVFDEEVWNATVESVYINTDKKITFSFKDGLELDWII